MCFRITLKENDSKHFLPLLKILISKAKYTTSSISSLIYHYQVNFKKKRELAIQTYPESKHIHTEYVKCYLVKSIQCKGISTQKQNRKLMSDILMLHFFTNNIILKTRQNVKHFTIQQSKHWSLFLFLFMFNFLLALFFL